MSSQLFPSISLHCCVGFCIAVTIKYEHAGVQLCLCPATYGARCSGKMTSHERWSVFSSSEVIKSKPAGASVSWERKQRGKSREVCERTTITQAACGFQFLAKTSHSASQTFSLSYPIPLSSPLAGLPTPTLDRTQMVWIRGLHDWAVATDEILKSDSLLSLNSSD